MNDPFSQSINVRDARCSLCGHPFPRSASKTFPFCSQRCQQIDLGQWLDEKLGLPIEGQEDQTYDGYLESEEAESVFGELEG